MIQKKGCCHKSSLSYKACMRMIINLPICSRSLLKVSPTITTYPVIAAKYRVTVIAMRYIYIQKA